MPNLDHMKELYTDRLVLLRDLNECLSSERESLVAPDLDALWSLIHRKQELTVAIREKNEAIRALLKPQEKMPHLKKAWLK